MHKKILFSIFKETFLVFVINCCMVPLIFFSFLQLCFLCICTSKQHVFAFATKKWRKKVFDRKTYSSSFSVLNFGVVPFNKWLILSWEENKCCYKLNKCTKWLLFHWKWLKLSFWVKIDVILSGACLNSYFLLSLR